MLRKCGYRWFAKHSTLQCQVYTPENKRVIGRNFIIQSTMFGKLVERTCFLSIPGDMVHVCQKPEDRSTDSRSRHTSGCRITSMANRSENPQKPQI